MIIALAAFMTSGEKKLATGKRKILTCFLYLVLLIYLMVFSLASSFQIHLAFGEINWILRMEKDSNPLKLIVMIKVPKEREIENCRSRLNTDVTNTRSSEYQHLLETQTPDFFYCKIEQNVTVWGFLKCFYA